MTSGSTHQPSPLSTPQQHDFSNGGGTTEEVHPQQDGCSIDTPKRPAPLFKSTTTPSLRTSEPRGRMTPGSPSNMSPSSSQLLRFPLRRANSNGFFINTARNSPHGSSPLTSPASPLSQKLNRIRPASPRIQQLSQPVQRTPILPEECKFSPSTNSARKEWSTVKPKYMDSFKRQQNENNASSSSFSGERNLASSFASAAGSSTSSSNSPMDGSPRISLPAGNNVPDDPLNSPKRVKLTERLKDLARPVLRKEASAQELDRECTFHPKTKFYKHGI